MSSLHLVVPLQLVPFIIRTSPLDPFLKLARWIARSEDPFSNFYLVFHAGMKAEGLLQECDELDEDDPVPM